MWHILRFLKSDIKTSSIAALPSRLRAGLYDDTCRIPIPSLMLLSFSHTYTRVEPTRRQVRCRCALDVQRRKHKSNLISFRPEMRNKVITRLPEGCRGRERRVFKVPDTCCCRAMDYPCSEKLRWGKKMLAATSSSTASTKRSKTRRQELTEYQFRCFCDFFFPPSAARHMLYSTVIPPLASNSTFLASLRGIAFSLLSGGAGWRHLFSLRSAAAEGACAGAEWWLSSSPLREYIYIYIYAFVAFRRCI